MTSVSRLWPTFAARDPDTLVPFLVDAFGFEVLVSYSNDDGRIEHAELSGPSGGGVMLGAVRPGDTRGIATTVSCYVVVTDVDALHERAVAAGGVSVSAPTDTDYGSRDCSVRDPEGNTWFFGTYEGHPPAD